MKNEHEVVASEVADGIKRWGIKMYGQGPFHSEQIMNALIWLWEEREKGSPELQAELTQLRREVGLAKAREAKARKGVADS